MRLRCEVRNKLVDKRAYFYRQVPGGRVDRVYAKVDEEYFVGTTVTSNVLVNIGRGDLSGITRGRLPCYDFDEVCSII